MTLTPATFRQDKKCGGSYIPDYKKCRQGTFGAAAGRFRDAKNRMRSHYESPPTRSNKNTKQALAVASAAALVGVGAAALAARHGSRTTPKAVNVQNITVPRPGVVSNPERIESLSKTADKARFRRLENYARGKDPELQARMQVQEARKNNLKQELQGFKSEMQRLRTEIGVWGPNRIKPFKRNNTNNNNDSIWASGFEP